MLPRQLKQVLHQPGDKAGDGVPAQRPSSAPPWQPHVPPIQGTPHGQQGKCQTRGCGAPQGAVLSPGTLLGIKISLIIGYQKLIV